MIPQVARLFSARTLRSDETPVARGDTMTARMIRAAQLAVAALAIVAFAACTANDEPPPRSPLGSTPASSVPPATDASPAASGGTATATPTPAPSSEGAPSPRLLEALVGNAIQLMAEWLGVSATDLALAEAEALVWSDGCLGVPVPGAACTQALVPGFRVVLRDPFGGLHRAHGGDDGRVVRWVGERILLGTIADATRDSITMTTADGEVTLLAAPGTRFWGSGLSPGANDLVEVAEGIGDAEVAVAADPSPDGDPAPVIAWLVVLD